MNEKDTRLVDAVVAEADPDEEPADIPHLPDPTPWPLVLALGLTLLGGGLVIEPLRPVGLGVSAIGLVCFMVALFMLVREDIALFEQHHS